MKCCCVVVGGGGGDGVIGGGGGVDKKRYLGRARRGTFEDASVGCELLLLLAVLVSVLF